MEIIVKKPKKHETSMKSERFNKVLVQSGSGQRKSVELRDIEILEHSDYGEPDRLKIIGFVAIDEEEYSRRQSVPFDRKRYQSDRDKVGQRPAWAQQERLQQMKKVNEVFQILADAIGKKEAYKKLRELGHLSQLEKL